MQELSNSRSSFGYLLTFSFIINFLWLYNTIQGETIKYIKNNPDDMSGLFYINCPINDRYSNSIA